VTHKHLSDNDVKKIIKLIQAWKRPKLTWDLLVDECNSKLGISRARQSLMKIDEITLAFKDQKAALKAPTESPNWVSDIRVANERIEQLSADNHRLIALNEKLLERFTVWQANAQMHGVTQEKLDQPRPEYAKRR